MEVTQEDLVANYQKGLAADKRMAEAAGNKKELDALRHVSSAVQRLEQQGWNEEDFRLVATHAGMAPEKQQAVVADFKAQMQQGQGGGKSDGEGQAGGDQRTRPVGFDDLDPAMQVANSDTYWFVQDAKMQDAIAADETLGKIEGDQAKKVFGLVKEKVKAYSGRSAVRPEVIKKAVDEVRGIVDDFGTKQEGSLPPGVGKPPNAGNKSVGDTDPPKRVAWGEPGWDANIQGRLEHAFRESQAKGGDQ